MYIFLVYNFCLVKVFSCFDIVLEGLDRTGNWQDLTRVMTEIGRVLAGLDRSVGWSYRSVDRY